MRRNILIIVALILLNASCQTRYDGSAVEYVKVTNESTNIEYERENCFLINETQGYHKTNLLTFGDYDSSNGYMVIHCRDYHKIYVELLNSHNILVADTVAVFDAFTTKAHSRNINFSLNADSTFTISTSILEY